LWDVVYSDPTIDELICQRKPEFLTRLDKVGRERGGHADSEALMVPCLAIALWAEMKGVLYVTSKWKVYNRRWRRGGSIPVGIGRGDEVKGWRDVEGSR